MTKTQSVCPDSYAMECNEVNRHQLVNFTDKLCNMYRDTNHNIFTNTVISDVSLYSDFL